MSGGHFEYHQHYISDIADEVERLIETNEDKELNEWGNPRGRHFSPEVIERFREALSTLRKARVYAQRIDWLVSDDDGEDSFLRRLEDELTHLDKD